MNKQLGAGFRPFLRKKSVEFCGLPTGDGGLGRGARGVGFELGVLVVLRVYIFNSVSR